jgi:hypothetical protein
MDATLSAPPGLNDIEEGLWNEGLDVVRSLARDPAETLRRLAEWAQGQGPRRTREANAKEDLLAQLKAQRSSQYREEMQHVRRLHMEARAASVVRKRAESRAKVIDTIENVKSQLPARSQRGKQVHAHPD